MTEKYCIENDFAAQKELAEMERTNIDKQWEALLELNALRTRAEMAEAKLATWQDDINAVLKQRDDLRARVARLEGLVQTLLDEDPNETIADNGSTVLCAWRYDARRALEEK